MLEAKATPSSCIEKLLTFQYFAESEKQASFYLPLHKSGNIPKCMHFNKGSALYYRQELFTPQTTP
ncbi:MAG: hypothetical protein PVJ92_03205, partial [Candidatus Dependentiae bacterium]